MASQLESDLSEKLRRVARLFHDEPFPLHRSRNVHQLVDHDPADTLSPELRRDEEIVEAERVAGVAGGRDGNEIADQFPEGTGGGSVAAAVTPEKIANVLAVIRIDRSDEESLSSHAQSSLCHAVTAYRENK